MLRTDEVRHVLEQAREIEVVHEADVCVVGGGPAGVCAAVSAARAGARTVLIERYGFLGGMWTGGMVLTLAGYNSWLRPYHRCVAGIPGEWLARAAAKGGAEDNESWVLNSDPEIMKLVADELVLEAGVTSLLHTWGARPIVEGDDVKGVYVENVDGRTAVLAHVTIDCSGDGDIFARSRAPWVKGETLQPMTMPFRVDGVVTDPTIDHTTPARIPIGPDAVMLVEPLLSEVASRRLDVAIDRTAMRAARGRGELPLFGGPWFGGLEKDIVWANTTRVLGDASDAEELTRAEFQARKDVQSIIAYFREHVGGFENVRLLHTSTQIGIRETRRLDGAVTLTGDDIQTNEHRADGIALGCWPIDVHPSEEGVGVHAMYVPTPYQIPYGCLVPKRTGGLLAAGRCISVDRDALGSTRVGATCAATGEAAGLAAALAARDAMPVADVDVNELRSRLRQQGALVDRPQVDEPARTDFATTTGGA